MLRQWMNLSIVVVCAAMVVSFPVAAEAETIVVVVRHAEKRVEPGNRDPALTDAGLERAEALALALRDIPITAVYCSDYRRTRATAAPTAKQAGVEALLRDPREPEALRDEILRDHRSGAVLVVGHSNTAPALLKSLGVADPPAIADDGYDDFFVVVIPDDRAISGSAAMFLRLHYGEPTIAE